MTPAGRIATAIDLLGYLQDAPKRPANAVANEFFRSRRYIGSGDRRFVSERVWSVLRARRRLGWWLNGAPPTPRLLVAASLLMEGWTRTAVAGAFSGGHFAAQPLSRHEADALARLENHTLEHPAMPDAVRCEVPDWILPRLAERFRDRLAAEMAVLAGSAPLDLRVNLLKGDRGAAREALAAERHDAVPTPFSPWGLRLDGRRSLMSGATFQSGLIEVQDEGSQLVALLTGAAAGMRVVDWCAGAGGKTLAMAAMMKNRGQIVACDVSASRLEGAVRRLHRAGVHNVERHLVETGDKWTKRRSGSFDRVLVDAPCSGTGTWRRNPDARLSLSPADVDELVFKQAGILDAAQSLVRKGGRLIYATCSMLIEENEAQVSAFLHRHPAFSVVPLSAAWPLDGPPPNVGDFLCLSPAAHHTDGFFAAVLERTT